MAKPVAINVHCLTADGIRASEAAKAAASTSSKSAAKKTSVKLSDAIREETVRDVMRSSGAPKSPKPVTREMKEFAARGMKFDPKKVNPNYVSDDEKEAQWYAHTIYRYYQKFPQLGKMPKMPDLASPGVLAKLKVQLEGMQSELNGVFGDDMSKGLAFGVTSGIEALYQIFIYDQPWNPIRGRSLAGFCEYVYKNYERIAPEMTELQILYASLFEQSVYTRLAVKLSQMGTEVIMINDGRAAQLNKPVQLDKKFDGL